MDAAYPPLIHAITAHLQNTADLPEKAFVHIEEQTPSSIVGTAWRIDGAVTRFAMQRTGGNGLRFGAAEMKDLEVDKATVINVVSMLLAQGTVVDVERAKNSLEAVAVTLGEARDDAQNALIRRNNALCELHYFHGWTSKVDLYELVGIDRSVLDTALQQYSLGNVEKAASADSVQSRAVKAEKAYRYHEREAETLAMFRDTLIRELRRGRRWPEHKPTQLAALTGLRSQRIAQICKPGYRQRHAWLKRQRQQRLKSSVAAAS